MKTLYSKKEKISAIKKITPAPKKKVQIKILFKIKTPDVFNRKRKELQNFLFQIKVYLMFNGALFIGGTDKVLIAGVYLRGKAYEWYSVYLQNYFKYQNALNTRKKGIKKIINDYNEFEKALKYYFENINIKRIAEKQLRVLKQVKSTSNYTAKF